MKKGQRKGFKGIPYIGIPYIMALFLALLTSGCAIHPLIATLYTSVDFHRGDHNQTIGPKKGESCTSNILGLIATGDASAITAARKAGISKVTSIDYKMTNILGLYATFCVIVTGE